MKRTLIIGALVLALLLGIVLYARSARADSFLQPPPPPPPELQPPLPPPPPITQDPTQARTGGLATNACNSVMSGYKSSVETGGQYVKAPPVVTKGVTTAYSAVQKINCGAVAIAEKAVGAVIVTPAKKIGKAFASLF